MHSYLLKRIAILIPTILGVVSIVFVIIHLIPGDPVEIMLGESALAAEKESLRHDLGLDRPVFTQYIHFLAGLAHFDLGNSIHTKEPILNEIISRWPATLELAFFSMFVAVILSIPLGILAAAKKDTVIDKGSLVLSLFGIAIPNFWLGPLLIILFSIEFGILPVSGRSGFMSLILPAVTLGSSMAAILVRLTRSSILEVIGEDFITAARAKGVSEWTIYIKHAFLNALLPIITVMGLQLGSLLAGAVITETIFSWPGIGRLIVTAIETRDYPLVQGCVLSISLGYVVINFIIDIIYAFIDPRIRFGN